MTQAVFPEIEAATQALEQIIATTESEIGQMKETITEKKQLIKGGEKPSMRSAQNQPVRSPKQ